MQLGCAISPFPSLFNQAPLHNFPGYESSQNAESCRSLSAELLSSTTLIIMTEMRSLISILLSGFNLDCHDLKYPMPILDFYKYTYYEEWAFRLYSSRVAEDGNWPIIKGK